MWKKVIGLQPMLKVSESCDVPEECIETIKTPTDVFNVMFFNDLILHVTNPTNPYTVKHGSKGSLSV